VEDFGAGGGWVVSCCGLVWMLDWIDRCCFYLPEAVAYDGDVEGRLRGHCGVFRITCSRFTVCAGISLRLERLPLVFLYVLVWLRCLVISLRAVQGGSTRRIDF
jgi:hypothetical protein